MNEVGPEEKREYNMSFKPAKDNTNTRQRKIDNLKEKLDNMENMGRIKAGDTSGMTREQASKATKGAAIDLIVKGDQHEELIGQIGRNLYDANDNLNNVAIEVDKQGKQIDKIGDDVADTQKIVGRTDKRITGMNRRVWCHKFLLNVMIVILFMAIVAILVVKLVNK